MAKITGDLIDREKDVREYIEEYADLFDLDPNQPKPQTKDWTGAEIRSCCRLAGLLDLPLVQAGQNVIPVAVTAAESVARLRSWARVRWQEQSNRRRASTRTNIRLCLRTSPCA